MIKTGVSYYGCRSLPHVERDLDDIKSNNVTYVVHTLSEYDTTFYKATMKEIFSMTRKKGMEVHADPWGMLGIFGGEAFSDIVSFRTDIRQVLSDKRSAAAACPNHPETLKIMKKWIDAAVSCGADIVFWDEPHFYMPGRFGRKEPHTVWGCLCKYCRDKYKRYGYKSFPATKTDRLLKFQDRSLIDFLNKIIQYTYRKGCKSTLCLLPGRAALERGLWERAAQIPNVVSIGTDPYWMDATRPETQKYFNLFFTKAARKIVSLSKRYKISGHLWIQNFKIKRNRENEVSEAIWRAHDLGIRDFAAWGYMGGNYMSSLSSDVPERVWSILGKTYWRLRNMKD